MALVLMVWCLVRLAGGCGGVVEDVARRCGLGLVSSGVGLWSQL